MWKRIESVSLKLSQSLYLAGATWVLYIALVGPHLISESDTPSVVIGIILGLTSGGWLWYAIQTAVQKRKQKQ